MTAVTYDWEVTEIINADAGSGRRGAMVTYTPVLGEIPFSVQSKFVPVPWHKATDEAHALVILERKVAAYAPTNDWAKDENPDPTDNSDTITAAIAAGTLPTGSGETAGPP